MTELLRSERRRVPLAAIAVPGKCLMTRTTYYDAFPAMEPVRLSTVETLLKRYPRISRNEITDISSFIRTASIIDLFILGANRSLSANLARFKHDNRAELGLQRSDLVALAAITRIIAIILIIRL